MGWSKPGDAVACALLACFTATCNAQSVDYTGKLCTTGECPTGWYCDRWTERCKTGETPPRPIVCDSASETNSCPLGENGVQMACFPGSQLGGDDYCVESCEREGFDESGFACVGKGERLEICDPEQSRCRAGFNCFRTDVAPYATDAYPAQVEGLCVLAPVCSGDPDSDEECAGHPTRKTCGGLVLREAIPEIGALLVATNLQCVEECVEGACSGDQLCLPNAVDYVWLPPICVPSCASKPCPPNFYCLGDAGPGYYPVCAPGVPGYRCERHEDCLLGYCVDTGAGFSLCTIDCESEQQCSVLDDLRGRSLCVEGVAQGDVPPRRHCMNSGALSGMTCSSSDHCPEGEICTNYVPYDPNVRRRDGNWECRRPCDADHPCAPIAGIPFTCMDNGQCYPGDMGIDCTRNEECMGELRCECVRDCDSQSGGVAICTKPCKEDGDCEAYSQNTMVCHDLRCMTPARAEGRY